jgi:uncharacterized membrane protein HdeD (DUF308 family)
MELTILLSKVFGIYLIIGGVAYVTRKKFFMSVVHDFVGEKMLRVILATVEIIAGLFLIFNHNVWGSLTEGIVSLIGWLLVVEGTFYLIMPDSIIRAVVKIFNKSAWYVGGGVLSVVAGVYLLNFAYNLF